MGTKDEIDWDDPEAVAAARGDTPEDEGGDEEQSLHRTDEEQAEIDAKAAEGKDDDKDADKSKAADKGDAAAEAGDEGKKEGEDGSDAEADASKKPDEDADKKEAMIPKSRLDTKTKQNKALQDRIDRYEQQDTAAATAKTVDDAKAVIETELGDLDAAITKAIVDDDPDEATRLRGVVRTKERELWQIDMDASAATTTDETREQVRLDLTIDHIESTYDQFNPDSKGYEQETVDKVQELRDGFFATGKYTATQALLRAMDYVLPKKDMNDVKDVADGAGKKADKEAELTKAGLKKATDAANKQPPDASKSGDDSDKHGLGEELNVDKLTYEDVASLPEATLKRMRGDTAS